MVFEDCSHAPIYQNVPEFNAKTLDFLVGRQGSEEPVVPTQSGRRRRPGNVPQGRRDIDIAQPTRGKRGRKIARRNWPRPGPMTAPRGNANSTATPSSPASMNTTVPAPKPSARMIASSRIRSDKVTRTVASTIAKP